MIKIPYIRQLERPQIDKHIDEIKILSPGHLNYAITRLIHNYIRFMGLRYVRVNDVIGVLTCVSKEFYRTVAAPYEREKHKLNGSISELDKNGE